MWGNNNEKKTEILTTDIIKKDLCRVSLENFKITAIILLLLITMLLLAYWYLKIIEFILYFVYVIIGILFAISSVIFIYHVIKLIQTFICIHNNKFSVVKDKLISAEERDHSFKNIGAHIQYFLNFSGYGKYKIPEENYKWSELFSMNEISVYNYSVPQDEFYLVIINNRIVVVYNCKLFDYIS